MLESGTPATTPSVTAAPAAPHTVRAVPSWQAVAVGLVLAIMLGVVAGVTAFYAQSKSNEHTDKRIALLEADRVERRRVADEANARRDQQIAETQRIVCVVLNRIQPRDTEVQRIRVQFLCDRQPDPLATPTGR